MAENIVTVLDTTVGDTGSEIVVPFNIIDSDIPYRFTISLGAGDTVVVEGKLENGDSYETIYTFTTETPIDIYLMRYMRVRRTVDGGGADSTVKVQNIFNIEITAHE